MVGHDKPAAVIERDVGKSVKLHRAQIAIKLARGLKCDFLFAIELSRKSIATRQAKAGQAVPALMLGEAQGAIASGGFADRFAELRGQHEAALFAAKRKALAAVADRLSLHSPCPNPGIAPDASQNPS